MAMIIEAVEEQALDAAAAPWSVRRTTKAGAICRAAVGVGEVVGATYLVAFTETGARRCGWPGTGPGSRCWRSRRTRRTRSQLALCWGVETFLVPSVKHTDDMVLLVDSALLDIARCEIGEQVVIVAGAPPGIPGSTNALRVHRMGDAVGGAAPAYQQ